MRRPSSSPLLPPPPPLLSNIIIIRIVKRKITCQGKKKKWLEKVLRGVSVFPPTSNPSSPFLSPIIPPLSLSLPHTCTRTHKHPHTDTHIQTTWIWVGLIISLQHSSSCPHTWLHVCACLQTSFFFQCACALGLSLLVCACLCVSTVECKSVSCPSRTPFKSHRRSALPFHSQNAVQQGRQVWSTGSALLWVTGYVIGPQSTH